MKKIFTLLTLLVAVVTGAEAASYIPTTVKEFTESQTLIISDVVTDAKAEGWIVIPAEGFNNKKAVQDPDGDIEVPTSNVSCLQVKADGGVFNSGKRVLHMLVKGISGVKAIGQANDGRGFVIGATPYTEGMSETTAMIVVAGNTEACNPVSYDGLDPEQTYIISIFAYSSDTYLYAVRFTAPDAGAPAIFANPASIMATESGVAATTDIAVTGANLTGTNLTARITPEVEGLSVELASNAIANGEIETTATISYVSTVNVDESTATLVLSDGTTTKEVTITYSAFVVPYEQESISTTTTWDFADVAGTVQFEQGNRQERLYANIPELTIKSSFNAKALTFEGQYAGRGGYAQDGTLRFNTTVPGTVTIEFSNTGGTNKNRYLKVNDQIGTVEADGTTKRTESFDVEAGDVAITGYTPTEGGNSALRFYKVEFTPSEVEPSEPIDIVMSFPETTYTITLGDAFTAPVLSVAGADGAPISLTGVKYNSSDTQVATVDETTGAVTVVGEGTTLISAYFEGNSQYNAARATYSLIVEAAPVVTGLTAVSPRNVFNISDFDQGSYEKSNDEVIVNNMGILASASGITISGSNKTVDGVKYTQCIKMAKNGSASAQNLHIKVNGPCQVSVIAVSANSSDVRTVAINIAGNEKVTNVKDPVKATARYNEAGEADVYVYGTNGGVNIYAIIVEEIAPATVDVAFNAYGIGTFYYSDKAFNIPEGVQAATYALSADNKKVAPHQTMGAGRVIAAGEPVVIKGEAGATYTFTEAIDANLSTDAENLLRGQEFELKISEDASAACYYYTLGAKNGVAGFYWGAADGGVFTLGAHKAYLALPIDVASQASFVMFDGETTAINAIQDNTTVAPAATYNLGGQRVNAQYKGVVIVNGKKQIRK